MINTRNREELRRDMLMRVQKDTPIQSPTGFAKAIMDHVSSVEGELYDGIDQVKKWTPSEAGGSDLDDLATVFGVTRKAATSATDTTGNNVLVWLGSVACFCLIRVR